MTKHILLASGLLLVACQTQPIPELPTSSDQNVNSQIGPISTGPKPGVMTMPTVTGMPSLTTPKGLLNVSQLAAIRKLRDALTRDPQPSFQWVDKDLLALTQDAERVRLNVTFEEKEETTQDALTIETDLSTTGYFRFSEPEDQRMLKSLGEPGKTIQALSFEFITSDQTVVATLSEPLSHSCDENTVVLTQRAEDPEAAPRDLASLCTEPEASEGE